MRQNYGRGIVIVGTQYGDEGKGKIVDYYASKPYIDAVTRFNGGANAGHTIITKEEKYALNMLPSGIVYGKPSYIGNGCVIDLERVKEELTQFPDKHHLLHISERAQLVLPHHKILDQYQEMMKQKRTLEVGTTRRGIGPAYHDKSSRFGIRFGDLWDEELLKQQVDLLSEYYQGFPLEVPKAVQPNHLMGIFSKWKDSFERMLCDTGVILSKKLAQGKNVLFEGAQSTLLDLDHGVYPFSTSSNCVVASASTGTGIAPQNLTERIGVVKAYTSRVGGGPIISEISDIPEGKTLQKEGREFGTSTGRPRRMAWLDLIAVKYARRLNGLTGLALTKVDILGHLKEFEVVVEYQGYETDSDFPSYPMRISDIKRIKPVTELLPSWGTLSQENWQELRLKGWDAFPSELKSLVKMIEDRIGIPILLVGIGPSRSEVVERNDLESFISVPSPYGD
ncbi:MAG: adenylosuccinate synthase [Candidatus Heimdallarchaeota archaeon]